MLLWCPGVQTWAGLLTRGDRGLWLLLVVVLVLLLLLLLVLPLFGR